MRIKELTALGALLLSTHLSLTLTAPTALALEEERIQADYSIIAARSAAALIDSSKSVLILDVRPAESYAEGHIRNAVHIDMEDRDFEKEVERLDSTRTILVYSHLTPPTQQTYPVLSAAGFQDVIYLRGGFREWRLSDLPYVDGGEEVRFDSSARGLNTGG